jgi:UDP-glucuronate 4-epimerase
VRILVTGVAGFIGSHLCERLLGQDHEVIGIDNFDPYYDHQIKRANLQAFLHHKNFKFFQTDIRLQNELQEMWNDECKDIDSVAHIAAKAGVRPSIEDPVGYTQTNVLGTLNLLNLAVKNAKIPKFIFASSSSVYGNNPKLPFSEDDRADNPISPYAATKRAAELLAHSFHKIYDLPVTALRFFTVFGPRQRPDLAIHKFTTNILRNEPIEVFGSTPTARDYTYIDDVIDGTIAAIERCKGFEIINLGSETPIPLAKMIETIEQVTKCKANIKQVPQQPGDVQQTYADINKARKLLGYEPKTEFRRGIELFTKWLSNGG